MGPVDALKLALIEEKKAMEMYEKYAREFVAAGEVFNYLKSEEYKHINIIQKKIFELTKM